MERVASEAGVARSTLYRYWDGPDALVAEMIDAFVDLPDVPDSGDMARDVANLLVGLADLLRRSSTWGQVLPSVIAASRVEEQIRLRVDRHTATRVDVLRSQLERAAQRHLLVSGVDIDMVVDQLVGPLYYRCLVRQVDTDGEWVHEHVASVLEGLTRNLRPA
jgi:AcrR family transcriptional regulator